MFKFQCHLTKVTSGTSSGLLALHETLQLTRLVVHKFPILLSLSLLDSFSFVTNFEYDFHNSLHQLVSLQMDQSNSLFLHEFLQNLSPASFSPNGSIKQPLLNLSSESPCSLFTRGCHQFVETQR